MLHLTICDDETASLSWLETLVRKWAAERKYEIAITLCQSAGQFLFGREEKQETDIMLLDIDMPGMNGLGLARRLREEGENVQIIFVTGLVDYVLEGYDVEAVSYLIKPVKSEKLFGCLDKAKERCRKVEPVLLLELSGGIARVKVTDICYLESDAHDTQVHCIHTSGIRRNPAGSSVQEGAEVTEKSETIRCRTGIRELEERLTKSDGGFFRIHRSYVVNLAYVSKIVRKEVLLDTGESLPVSRGRWEALNRAYLKYYANFLEESL